MKRISILALWISLWAALLFTSNAQAQQPVPTTIVTDNEVNTIAKQLYCPVCENIPLDVCPTQACAEWRELIRLKLSEGWNAEQISAYFAEQYGERVLAEPPAQGFNWLVYLAPPAAILAGIVILIMAIRSWQRQTPNAVESNPAQPQADLSKMTEEDYIQRLEEELRKASS